MPHVKGGGDVVILYMHSWHVIVVWSILCVYICMRALVCAVFHELLVPLRVPRCDRDVGAEFLKMESKQPFS